MTWCQSFGWFDRYDAWEQSWIGVAIRESLWLFPGIEAIHLLGLAVLGGSVLVVDLRLVGLGLTRLSPAQVLAAAKWWFLGSLGVMLATGIPLFLSEAVKCCFNNSFEVKMAALALGVVFTFGVRNRLVMRGEAPAWLVRLVAAAARTLGERTVAPQAVRAGLFGAVGFVSLGIWFTVAAAGRWIGFS